MVPLLTRAQMIALDQQAIHEVGIASLVLMEVAGRAVADAVEGLTKTSPTALILALAGTGNNGADAVVAARHLHERGFAVAVLVVGEQERLTPDARTQLEIAARLGVPFEFAPDESHVDALDQRLEVTDILIDGLFGTGLSRPLQGWPRTVVERVAADEDISVVAVDMPSGVDGDTGQILGAALPADVTVTFQYPKLGHALYPGRGLTGALTIADIGIPPSRLLRVDPKHHIVSTARLREAFAPRAADSHKGTYGHLLVVAGAPDRPGSALLAGRAALRTGAGLVTIGSDRETIARLAPALEALMGLKVGLHGPDPTEVLAALSTRTALAVGPSLPPDARTARMLRAVLQGSSVPAVVDASALTALGADIEWLKPRQGAVVLTPHPGEMAALLGLDTAAVQQDRLRAALTVADRAGAHVVLKGASTVVAHPDGRAGVVVAGNPGMSTAGTGDVLTGIIGALLARGVAADVAAEAGALVHAMAGDRGARSRTETGLIASDLLLELPQVLRAHVELEEDPA